jgi:hypothetical protein
MMMMMMIAVLMVVVGVGVDGGVGDGGGVVAASSAAGSVKQAARWNQSSSPAVVQMARAEAPRWTIWSWTIAMFASSWRGC